MNNTELLRLLRQASAELSVLASYVEDPDTVWPNLGLKVTAKAQKKLRDSIEAALAAHNAAPAAASEREDGTFEVVPPLSEKSPPWHRVSMAVTEIVEREGYFGCVLVGFKQKPDAWDVEAMVDSAPGLNVESVRPEMLVAALTIIEKLRDQTIRYYLAKNRETEGDSAPKETK